MSLEGLFYLQDKRSIIGNTMVWWKKHCAGYTTDLDQAQTFSQGALERMHLRETDIPWPAGYIDRIAGRMVDVQRADRSQANCTNKEVTK